MTDDKKKPTCFIAMPITTHEDEADRYGSDKDHWKHVMEHLFVPAIEAAGHEPIRPVSKGSSMIHGEIVKHLSEADMVLCDLSGHNPNVFFELGVRTSLNLPVALVKDQHTKIPFDLGGMNTHDYNSSLDVWALQSEINRLSAHLKDGDETCKGSNPLWQRFGLTIKAEEPTANESPIEAKLDLMIDEFRRNQELISSTDETLLHELFQRGGSARNAFIADPHSIDRLNLDPERHQFFRQVELFYSFNKGRLLRVEYEHGDAVIVVGNMELTEEQHRELVHIAKRFGLYIAAVRAEPLSPS